MFSLDNVQAVSSFKEPIAACNKNAKILSKKLKKSTDMLKAYYLNYRTFFSAQHLLSSTDRLLSSDFPDIKDFLYFFETPAEPNAALIFSLKSIKSGYAGIVKKLEELIEGVENRIKICERVLSYADEQVISILGEGVNNVHSGVIEYMKDVKEIKWEDEVNSLRSGAKEFIEDIKEIEAVYASGLEKLRSITRYLHTRNRVEGEEVDSDLSNLEERVVTNRSEIVSVLVGYAGGFEKLELQLNPYFDSYRGKKWVPLPSLLKITEALNRDKGGIMWSIARSLPTSKQVKGEKIDSGLPNQGEGGKVDSGSPNQRGASRQLREEIVEALDDVGGNIWWRLGTFGHFMNEILNLNRLLDDSGVWECKHAIARWRFMKEKSASMNTEPIPSIAEAVDLAACLIDMLEMERIDNDPSYDDFEAEKSEVALSQLNSR